MKNKPSKIVLVSVGTRGDMEPFLAVGELLKARGHEVITAFPEQFRDLAEDTGLAFASLGSKLIELLESDTGRAAMGGSTGWNKIRAIIKLAQIQGESQKELVVKQKEILEQEQPDIVVYNYKATYPILWAAIHRKKVIYLSPLPYMHYVENHAHLLFNGNYGRFINKLTYKIANWGMLRAVKQAAKWLDLRGGMDTHVVKQILSEGKSVYLISPALFPAQQIGGKNIQILGFHERKKTANWQADPALINFLDQHPKILLITFGSMLNSQPVKNTQILLDLLAKYNIPTIINTAAGGLLEPADYDRDLFHFVSRIPYEYLFPKMYAVIHHGGAGTTHMALKYGCASMIIPHIVDQFAWNDVLSDLGVGPKGMKISKLKPSTIEAKILALMTESRYKQKAMAIKKEMAQEDFTERLYHAIVE